MWPYSVKMTTIMPSRESPRPECLAGARRCAVDTEAIVSLGGGGKRRAQLAYAGMGKCSLTTFDSRIAEVRLH